MRCFIAFAAIGAACAAACIDEPPPFESCFDPSAALPAPAIEAPTYFADVKPLIDQKCVRCHEPGGIGPFPLTTHPEVADVADAIKLSIVARSMPPFQADDCCAEYREDFSLADDEIALIARWVDDGAPAGDPSSEPAPRDPIGGLTRVDVVAEMPEPYIVSPGPGRTDDFRCFVLDWPIEDRDVFVTGLNPVPSNRKVLHHLTVGVVEGQELDEARDLDDADTAPGFACEGGVGSVRTTGYLGGSLLGADYPEGLGHRMPAGAKILLNVHYSLAHVASDADPADQLAIEFKIDDNAERLRTMPISNPAWLIGDAFRVEADEQDKVFRVVVEPDTFKGNRAVRIFGVTPHMHSYGTRLGVAIIRAGAPLASAERACLLDIPFWDAAWEQPYWLAEPIVLEKDDRVLLECHIANGFSIGPDGDVREPRDIAWGEGDQAMCAAFLQYALEDGT